MADVTGSSGNDVIHVAGDNAQVPSGYYDVPLATDGDDLINAGAGNDIIYTGSGNDVVNAGSGTDEIWTGWIPGYQKMVDGGTGVDYAHVDLSRVNNADYNTLGLTLNLGTAHGGDLRMGDGSNSDIGDVYLSNVERFDITFGVGNDNITGGNYDDILTGDPGNADVPNEGGNDILHGGGGNDKIDGGGGLDQLYGDDGNDTIYAGDSRSSTSADANYEDFCSDQLYGGAGDDVLYGATGDLLDGGSGHDRASIDLRESHYSYNIAFNRLLSSSLDNLGDGASLGRANTQTRNLEHIDLLQLGDGNDRVTADTSQFGAPLGGHFSGGITLGAGNDLLTLTGTLTPFYQYIDGGLGNDTVHLTGDYSTAYWLDYRSMANVETLQLGAGDSYSFVLGHGGDEFTLIDGHALGASDTLNINYETWGANSDLMVRGGAGNDTVQAGANFGTTQGFDGGAGFDTLALNGVYASALTFTGTMMTNVEQLALQGSHTYSIILAEGNVAAGQTLQVLADPGATVTVDGHHETNGHLQLTGGNNADTLIGGASDDVLTGGLGADVLKGGAGSDTFAYSSAAESNNQAMDQIKDFDAMSDKIQLWYAVNAVDSPLSGDITNLKTIADAGHLGAHDALVFSATNGHSYLVIDANGVAGYQAGQDMLIRIDGAANLASLSTASFVTAFHA